MSPRDQNPQGAETGGGTAEAQLADPNRPHRSPSAREERRAEERKARNEADDGDEDAGSHEG